MHYYFSRSYYYAYYYSSSIIIIDSFIHLTFIKGTPPSPIKSSYRLYYNSNPDNKNGLRDILTILAEILSQIFDTTEEINTKFWCDKPNNNWYSLLDKNHLPNSIKVEFKKNLLSLMSAILFLSCKKKMAPPDEKKMAPPDEKKNKSKSKSRSISRR